jgi:hypothetical protein
MTPDGAGAAEANAASYSRVSFLGPTLNSAIYNTGLVKMEGKSVK